MSSSIPLLLLLQIFSLIIPSTHAYILLQSDYTGVAVDIAGQRAFTTSQNHGISLSTNAGQNWTFANVQSGYSTGNWWQGPSVSSDGKILAAMYGYSSREVIYVSQDYGDSWNEVSYPLPSGYDMYMPSVNIMTGDAAYILAVPFLIESGTTTIKAQVILSSSLDFKQLVPVVAAAGDAFSESWLGSGVTYLAASSQSGSTVFAFCISNHIYTVKPASSSSPASSFIVAKATIPAAATFSKGPIAMDATGQHMASAFASSGFNSGIMVSNDYGASFASLASYPSSVVCAIGGLAMTSDGTIIVAYCPNTLHVSTDSGTTWNTHITPASNSGGTVALSGTGDLLLIALDNGAVWVSTDLGVSMAPRGVPVPEPTAYPTMHPSYGPPTPPPSARPSMAPTSRPTNPTSSPTPVPSAPTSGPSARPTSPTLIPSPAPTALPSYSPKPTTCTCPYSFSGSGSASVCNSCVQAAACCVYCSSAPSAMCQTAGQTFQCSNPVSTTGGCGGSASSGGVGGSSSEKQGGFSLGLSMPAAGAAGVWAGVAGGVCVVGLLAFLGLRRMRRGVSGGAQGQGQALGVQGQGQVFGSDTPGTRYRPSLTGDTIPAPMQPEVVVNPLRRIDPAFSNF